MADEIKDNYQPYEFENTRLAIICQKINLFKI
jgi:hypothetical protein